MFDVAEGGLFAIPFAVRKVVLRIIFIKSVAMTKPH